MHIQKSPPIIPGTGRQQRGAVLVISLIILLLMTIIGVVAMQGATLEERMAGNVRDNQIAFNAAEAALRAGELSLSGEFAVLPVFSSTGGAAGSCHYTQDNIRWANWSAIPQLCVYAIKAEFIDPETARELLYASPDYYLEEIEATSSDIEAGTELNVGMYRITARGFGSSDTATVILQSTFRR